MLREVIRDRRIDQSFETMALLDELKPRLSEEAIQVFSFGCTPECTPTDKLGVCRNRGSSV